MMKRWVLCMAGAGWMAACALPATEAEAEVDQNAMGIRVEAREALPAGAAELSCAEQPSKGACYFCCDRRSDGGFAPFDTAVAACRARGGRNDECAQEGVAACDAVPSCVAALQCAVASVCREKP